MPRWYETALAGRREPQTCITFARDFLAAPAAERAEVIGAWDLELRWALPDPWRLACADEGPGSPVERIRAELLFQVLGFSRVDLREVILGFAVVHHSCRLAGVDPSVVFEETAEAVGGAVARALRDFVRRDEADKTMEAFKLEAIANPAGGYELRADW